MAQEPPHQNEDSIIAELYRRRAEHIGAAFTYARINLAAAFFLNALGLAATWAVMFVDPQLASSRDGSIGANVAGGLFLGGVVMGALSALGAFASNVLYAHEYEALVAWRAHKNDVGRPQEGAATFAVERARMRVDAAAATRAYRRAVAVEILCIGCCVSAYLAFVVGSILLRAALA